MWLGLMAAGDGRWNYTCHATQHFSKGKTGGIYSVSPLFLCIYNFSLGLLHIFSLYEIEEHVLLLRSNGAICKLQRELRAYNRATGFLLVV